MQRGGLGQLGDCVGRTGVGMLQRVAEQLLRRGEIAGRHEFVRLGGEFAEAGGHAPSCLPSDGQYKS